MSDPQKYIDDLRLLYDDRKIGVSPTSPPFDCCHLKSCRAAAKTKEGKKRDLCLGAEAHVGEKYGDPIRLVVVSMDTGGEDGIEKGEDLLQRRSNVQGVTCQGSNKHMKGTIKILKHLYGPKPEGELLKRFAMINSAKCSGKDKSKSSMPWELYKNCWDHGHAELEKLDPELIVAQGAYARHLLNPQKIDKGEIQRHIPNLTWGDADVGAWICTQIGEYLKYWKNGNRNVLMIQVPHPSARGGQWQLFVKIMLPTIAHAIRVVHPNWGLKADGSQ